MARKIGQQARRTRELVSGLLSFAQQSPGEKTLLDMGPIAGERAADENAANGDQEHSFGEPD